MRSSRLTYLLAAATLFASCSDIDIYETENNPTESIAFSNSYIDTRGCGENSDATDFACTGQLLSEDGSNSLHVAGLIEDWDVVAPATRANTGVTETKKSDINKFYATCVRRNADGTAKDYYFQDIEYKESGSIFQKDGSAYYWAGTAQEDYDFYTYSALPEGASTSNTSPNPPTINYTVPTDNTKQNDIVTAKYLSAPANWGQVVPLDFKHIMTAIRFKAADNVIAGQIKNITISGVNNTGTFSFSGNAQTADSWTTSGSGTYSITPEVNISGGTSGNQTITLSDYIGSFVLLPQTIGEGATITVTFNDGYSHTDFTLSMSLAGHVWPMGRVITYVISTSQIEATPVFEVTSSNATTLTSAGGDVNFAVTSHIELTSGSTTGNYKVAWTSKLGTYDEATGVFTEAAQEDYPWFNISGLSGDGTQTGAQSVTAPEYYLRGKVVPTDSHLIALKASTTASSSSQSSPYNLATKGGTESESTANCYIVDGPGWYSFPLVYGNAIKEGATNSSAYSIGTPTMTNWVSPYNESGTEKGGYLSAFKDGNNTTISSPNISGASTAELIWSNEDGVIQNVAIDNTNKRVVFYVPQETITQNNALIAVRNSSNTILWSWHIWVTDRGKSADDISVTGNSWYQYSSSNSLWSDNNSINTSTNLNTSYSFMDVPLGYRDECYLEYPARSVWVEFEQTGTGQKAYVEVTQNGKAKETREAQTMYYQFGRKDPFSQYVGTTTSSVNGTNTDLYPYYYNGRDSYKQTGGNSYTYQNYTNAPDIYYYGTSTFPSYWNPWNNSTTIPTYNSGTTQYNIYNYLCNYFINDPSRVVKTVYDPSPRGYTVMPGQSISGFTALGLTAGTNSNEWPSYQACVWTGTNTKNINCSNTSAASDFGEFINFYKKPMTDVGTANLNGGETIGNDSTIGFQVLGSIYGSSATFRGKGYYWTANKERNITEASGNSLSIKDTYQSGCAFTFGTTLTDNNDNYAVTTRTKTAFRVTTACAVRCTKE